MYRSAFVSLLLATAVLRTGCGGEASTQTAPAAGDRPVASVEPAESSTSAPAEPPVQPRRDRGTDEQGTDDQRSSRNGSGSDGSSGDGTSGGTEGLPGWPIESTPVHGGQFWAAYLAVGAPGDPALQRVLEDGQRLWPGAGLGGTGVR